MIRKLYNLRKLNEITQGDPDFIQEMVVTFVENVSIDIESIHNLKLSDNWKGIAEIAHKLASNYAYLGADNLHALAVNIEKSVVNDHNLSGILEKVERLCSDSSLLINELRKDFEISGSV